MTIQRGFSLSLAMAFTLLAMGCQNIQQGSALQKQSPLEVRARETRTFENNSAKGALKTVLNVLQDDGFFVDYGSADLGLLHANSNATIQGGTFFWFGRVSQSTEATVNVTEVEGGARVRVNFQIQVRDSQGYLIETLQITDPKFYQEFFAKVDRALFIQKQGI